MFEKVIKELEKMQKTQVSVPINTDDEGYYDKECPSENCLFKFKVLAEDWKNKFNDEAVYCPFCGHEAPANSFWTTEQIKASKKQAINIVKNQLNKAFSESAKDFNRKQPKNGFITMKMKFSGTTKNNFILPIPALKELEQKRQCEKCGSHYSILGSAFFCPCCGFNSVNKTFDDAIIKINTKIKNIGVIRNAVSKLSPDEAEITVRSLIETGLSDAVVAFQRFCELTYKNNQRDDRKVKFNAFQNLEIGAEYWNSLFNESYKDWLTEIEYRQLNTLFQKRHLLAHCEGIVDDKYIRKSNDTSYKAGQRLVIRESDVISLMNLVKKIIEIIRVKISNTGC